MGTKWTTLYKYVPLKYATEIIKNKRMYLSDGSNFNDPFEITIVDRTTKKASILGGLHILCLTNSYQNKLIWSHYSEAHRSICITVQVPNRLVYPICYSKKKVFSDSDVNQLISDSKRICKKSVNNSFDDLSYEKKVAYIKDRKWEYEKEYRIVFDKNDEQGLIHENGNWYMPLKIKNIYLGVNFEKNDEEIKQSIMDACKQQKIQIRRMTLGEDTYSIKVLKKGK